MKMSMSSHSRRWHVLAALLAGLWFGQPLRGEEQATNETAPPDDGSAEFDDFEEYNGGVQHPGFDPLGGYNRIVFNVNDKLYFWVLKPVAQGYGFIVPEPVRVAVGKCSRNLMFPRNAVNNLLQAKWQNAGVETGRFCVNSTIGILGLFDPAGNRLGWEPHPEDFGQTLGAHGVGAGVPIVWPLLGPSNLRDTLGLVPDYFLDPVSYLDSAGVRLAVHAGQRTNMISLRIGEYEDFKAAAYDPYVMMRDAYGQNRNREIEE